MTEKDQELIDLIAPWVAPLGYEIVYLETQAHGRGQKVLRIFIDRSENSAAGGPAIGPAIGIEDCVKVSRALDEPLDQIPELEAVFKGPYELEVSSPGVDRPLRQAKDYERFQGKEARIHVFRPLSVEELGNSAYQARNPKQKNFVGKLAGMREDKVVLSIAGKVEEEITIPLPLISKANLEPKFEI